MLNLKTLPVIRAESPFSLSAGRKSFALKRIVVLVILLDNTS